jgi:hypothetical protein
MEFLKFKEEIEKFDTEFSSINIEEEAQDLELSGFTTAGSFSTAACFGACWSSGSSLSSAGD